MFENVSNGDISAAIDELTTSLGVKEETPFSDFLTLLRKNSTEEFVQEIATRFLLPIRIILSYVPKDFTPDNTNRFQSSAMTRTDWTGRGIDGITAQVAIPENLPMYGTSGLQGYPIPVRVSENCHEHPETFMAVIAHELSHILLASIWHPQKDSELHTDIVPILLGFRDIVQRGRRTIESMTSGNMTTTRTTTYGYLTDSQFDFACSYVTGILNCHQRDKKQLIKIVKQMQHDLKKAERSLETFRDYFKYLDRQPPAKMRQEHAKRVVDLHTQDYHCEWENRITAIRKSLVGVESFVRYLNHYTSGAVDRIKTHTQSLKLSSDEISQVTEVITKDLRILRRYVGYVYRLRRTLWH